MNQNLINYVTGGRIGKYLSKYRCFKYIQLSEGDVVLVKELQTGQHTSYFVQSKHLLGFQVTHATRTNLYLDLRYSGMNKEKSYRIVNDQEEPIITLPAGITPEDVQRIRVGTKVTVYRRFEATEIECTVRKISEDYIYTDHVSCKEYGKWASGLRSVFEKRTLRRVTDVDYISHIHLIELPTTPCNWKTYSSGT